MITVYFYVPVALVYVVLVVITALLMKTIIEFLPI
jgi:hypothetical protein